MPSMRTSAPRPEKVAQVDEVKERLAASSAVLVTEYRGLTVAAMAELRRSLRAAGSDYKVYKNTLMRFAAQAEGMEAMLPLLSGPTAVAFVSGDVSEVAKVIRDFGRTNPALVLKGGMLGEAFVASTEALALADLPSKEVLLARIAGAMLAPMQQMAGLLQALPQNFAYGLQALVEKRSSDGGEPAAEAGSQGE